MSLLNNTIVSDHLSSLVSKLECALSDLQITKEVAVLTFGSAGGHFFVSNSDTDLTVLLDDSVPVAMLNTLQVRLYQTFGESGWNVAFKAWDRVRVNPMDVLSLRFLAGNYDLFVCRVLNDPLVAEVCNEERLITTLAGNDLHMEFMASAPFSRLLSRYHTTDDMPLPICYGDVKYYLGGTRAIQDILMIALVYEGKKFLTDVRADILVERGVFAEVDLDGLKLALDFLLFAKNNCVQGSNIFAERNATHLRAVVSQDFAAAYKKHTTTVKNLCTKAHAAFVRDFGDRQGVVARTTVVAQTLLDLIDTDDVQIWRTIALRTEVPSSVKEKLMDKIEERQQHFPHTMLDEMRVMLAHSRNALTRKTQLLSWEEQDATDLWLTDRVVACFESTLNYHVDRPDLIRLAVHKSFFELYRVNKFSDISHFYESYFDRVKKFFHCHTLCPDTATDIAKSACEQILDSGLFNPLHLSLLELHLTDRCNLECSWCTYKKKEADREFPYEDLARVVDLAPNEILIAGGGEPTLYQDRQYGFNEVIAFLRTALLGSRLRIITNGTTLPRGDWVEKVDEISVSLDSDSASHYLASKGRDLFETVWSNFETYLLRSPVTTVRLTKVFDTQNYGETFPLVEKVYALWERISQDNAKRRSFRFLLFAGADDDRQEEPYQNSCLSDTQIAKTHAFIEATKTKCPGLYQFIHSNTNIIDVVSKPPQTAKVDTCWPPTHYALIGADRKIYPCFAACSHFNTLSLGNIDMPPEELLEMRSIFASYRPQQCALGCRPGSVFYGLRAQEYRLEQQRLGIAAVELQTPKEPTIVHVSYQDPDHLMGGQGWAVYNLCKEQVKRGDPVYWISPCIKDEQPGEYLYCKGLLRVIKIRFTDDVVETLFSDEDKTHSLRMAFGTLFTSYILEHFMPENCVVHLHGFIETPSHARALRAAGYRVLSTFHMLLSTRHATLQNNAATIKRLRALEQSALAANTLISASSSGMINDLYQVHPTYEGEAHLVFNGVGEECFTTALPQEESVRPLILSYGRISPEKGFDIFIGAAKMLLERLRATETAKSVSAAEVANATKIAEATNMLTPEFMVVGNTDFSIEARRLYAERLVQSAATSSNIQVTATTEGITGKEKIALIDRALFGVILSRYEPFGMVIPEMMARGKPVVSTRTSGAIDIMQTDKLGINDFGIIVEANTSSVAEALLWLLDHPCELRQMSKNAFERAKDFTWSNAAKQFDILYRSDRI